MSKKTDLGIIRSIDSIGRLVIPIEVRRELGLSTGDPVHMYVANGKVIVEKYTKTCFLCGKSATEYNSIHNKRVCRNCINLLNGFDAEIDCHEETETEE